MFSNLSMDTLDYTGPQVNLGSKGVLLGVGEAIRKLPRHFAGDLPVGVCSARIFCGGCLVLQGPRYNEEPECAKRIASAAQFKEWPLIVLVDDADKATASTSQFLWTTFTRFEPGADIHAAQKEVVRNHLCYHPPVVIDARMKPWYPSELECDPDTSMLVSRRWSEYFS